MKKLITIVLSFLALITGASILSLQWTGSGNNRFATTTAGTTGWHRPSDWLALPTITNGMQEVAGLYAVNNTDANYVALTCSGNYQVVWGDGTTNLVNAGVAANHQYNFSTLSSITNSAGNKMAVVVITPQAGQNLTSVDFTTLPTNVTTSSKICVNWLDITVCSSNLTTLKIGNGLSVNLGLLQQCTILDQSVSSMAYMFNNCYSLQSVPLFNTANVTSMENMFFNCYSLQSVPLFNTANVNNMTSMFYNCYSLQSVPLFNTANVTSMAYMFQNCYSLQSVPLFNTANVNNMANMFNNCSSLQSCSMTNISTTVSFANCMLSSNDLNTIYGDLITTNGQTVTVTGNYGAPGNTNIAFTKGWTVIN